MAEKEYIDKVAFNYAIRDAVKKYPNSFYNGLEVARQIAHDFPAADVRPVVLCRDCRHRDPEDHKCDCGQLERAGCVFPVDDNYFCSYGEKREES